jgi:hypothetical protein
MRYLLNILIGLGLPLAFAATVLALGWDLFDGPGEPWAVLLAIACVIVGFAIGAGFEEFMLEHGTEEAGTVVAAIAAAVIVIAGLIGADQWLLHEHGRDVACRVTAITEHSDNDGTSYEYGLACDGGTPKTVAVSQRYDDIKQGQLISVRYDPVGRAASSLSREASDGHTALTIAAIGVGATLLLGLVTALAD